MIVCGWCGNPTAIEQCSTCQHPASVPWTQRGLVPPSVDAKSGRPALDERAVRKLWSDAKQALVKAGKPVTLDGIAEQLDRSPRTVREWRVKYGLR